MLQGGFLIKDIIELIKDLDFSDKYTIPHKTFAAMIADRSKTGKGINLICRDNNVNTSTLLNLLKSEPEAMELWKLADEIFLDTFTEKAQKALEEILDDKENPARFKAVQFVLEKLQKNFKKESSGDTIINNEAIVFVVKNQGVGEQPKMIENEATTDARH